MVAWTATIPFAQSAPVAVAYSVANPEVSSASAFRAAEQTFRADASVTDGGIADLVPLRFDWRGFLNPRSADDADTPTPLDLSTPAASEQPSDLSDSTPRPDTTPTPDATPAPNATPRPELTATSEPTDKPTDRPDPTATPRPRTAEPTSTSEPTASPTAKPTAAPTPQPTQPPTSYSGTNHFWYPALNIDASWGWYGCDYGGPDTMPGGIWRWGCGPGSNTYLLGHAWSTFKKIRTAYHQGTMQVGQNVWYANAQGDVTKWEVKWIRRVTAEYLNATAGDWALDDSPTPIMTLQTCDGSQSQLRIIVRLVPAN
jgi:hypothetical protein